MKGKKMLFFAAAAVLTLALIIIPRLNTNDSADSFENETEKRIAELCSSVEGVGKCRVMVTFEKTDGKNEEARVYSVAVLCEGADNITVRARLVGLISSLYGIGSNRVSVVKLGN